MKKKLISFISAVTVCGASLASMAASADMISKTYEDFEQYLIDSGYVKMSSAHLAYDDGHGNTILDSSLEDRYCAYFKPSSDEKKANVSGFSGLLADKTGYDQIIFRTSAETDKDLITELIASVDPDLQLILFAINESGSRTCSVSYGVDSCRYMNDKVIASIYDKIAEKELITETFKYCPPNFQTAYVVGALQNVMFPVKNIESLDAYLEETGAGFEYVPQEYFDSKECTSREGHSSTDDCPKTEWVYCDIKQTKEYTQAEYWSICSDIAKITEGMFDVQKPTKASENLESMPDTSVEMFNTVMGDTNNNGTLDLGDAILIMQSLGNPDEYRLTAQQAYNADIVGGDGVTNLDAQAIQKKLLKLE